MASWSEWYQIARERNFPLDHFLKINQSQDLIRLQNSGLPQGASLTINGEEFDVAKIEDFFCQYHCVWVRIVNKITKQRHYKLGMKSCAELFSFLEDLKIDVKQYNFQLYEDFPVKFGGNVLTTDSTVIEIVEGNQDSVGKSRIPFFHGFVNEFGRLVFREKEVPGSLVKASQNVLKYLKKSGSSYLEGYFEFIISEDSRVFFVDYKTGFTP